MNRGFAEHDRLPRRSSPYHFIDQFDQVALVISHPTGSIDKT
jgi:hypothetical protein